MVAAMDSKSIPDCGVPVQVRPGVRNRNGVLAWMQRHCKNVSTNLATRLQEDGTIGPETRCRNAADFYIRTGPIPGNLKQSDMKILEVHGTTGTTAFPIRPRAMVEEKGVASIIEKIIGEYGQKIVNGPDYLREYNLRIVITESISDGNGVFKIWATTYRDYKFENGGVAFIGEKTL